MSNMNKIGEYLTCYIKDQVRSLRQNKLKMVYFTHQAYY
jgi:hypothetical protein